jgi:hypothetical protein
MFIGQENHTHGAQANLEPRKSFKIWSETVAGRCRAWTDEQLETAGVLALVYGKVGLMLKIVAGPADAGCRSSLLKCGDRNRVLCRPQN